MTYTVYYKKVSSLFWKKLKRVRGDGMIDETSGINNSGGFTARTRNSARWFILEDESRVEIPVDSVMFRFSRERYLSIMKQMEREAGQKML